MKARYQFRFYPTSQQQQSLALLFGCVRVVWNDALALCKQSEKKPKSAELQKEFRTIGRWEATSEVRADCGFKWGKIDLSVPSVLCLNCGTQQDRDLNAARNIHRVGIGHCHDSKWAQRQGKTTLVAPVDEASRITALLGR
jgi:putative transposase